LFSTTTCCPSFSVILLLQKIDISKFDRDFWRVAVFSEL
jgi:hypothetical protein